MHPCRRLNLIEFILFFLTLYAFSQLVSANKLNVTLNGNSANDDGGSGIMRGNNRSFARPERRYVGSLNRIRTIAKMPTTISPLTTTTTSTTVDPLIEMVYEAKHAFQPITGNNNALTRHQLKLQHNGRFNMQLQTTAFPHHLRHQNSPANLKRKSINSNTTPSIRWMSHRQMTTPRMMMTTLMATTKPPKSTVQYSSSKMNDKYVEDIDDVLDDDEDDYFEDSVEIDDLDVSGSSQHEQKRRFDWMHAVMNNAIAASITKGGRQRTPNYKDYHRLGWDFKEYPDDEPIEKINIKKLSDYDTKEALDEAIRKEQARLHFISVSGAAECRLPQPRVIHVDGNPLNTYVPPCTILHRCGVDTGCCESPLQICAPKNTEIVQLMFYVLKLGKETQVISPLSFINHTECHCVTQTRQRNQNHRNENLPIEFQTASNTIKMKSASGNSEQIFTTSSPMIRLDHCKCTESFTEIFEFNTEWENTSELDYDNYPYRRCRCDCLPTNAKCRRLKNGIDIFTRKDRGCIMEGRCTLPTCEYGQYKLKKGHCPVKTEKNRSFQRLSFD